MSFKLKYLLLIYLVLNSTINYGQIIIRLWEAEASAAANVAALSLIKDSEEKVRDEITKLNAELRKQIPYYGLMEIFNVAFEKDKIISSIRSKLSKLNTINEKVPLLFNRKKKTNRRRWMMYKDYLDSIDKDVDNDLSNNGNLLKTTLDIVSELEKIEKEVDDTLEDLTIAERIFKLF